MNLFFRLDSNWLPRSDVRLRGTPNLETPLLMKARATECVVMSIRDAASGQRVNLSAQVRMNR